MFRFVVLREGSGPEDTDVVAVSADPAVVEATIKALRQRLGELAWPEGMEGPSVRGNGRGHGRPCEGALQ